MRKEEETNSEETCKQASLAHATVNKRKQQQQQKSSTNTIGNKNENPSSFFLCHMYDCGTDIHVYKYMHTNLTHRGVGREPCHDVSCNTGK